MKNYRVEWEETTRYSINIKAPGPEEARECFWWLESDGTLHDRSVEIDGGGAQDVSVTHARGPLSVDFTYKEYLARC